MYLGFLVYYSLNFRLRFRQNQIIYYILFDYIAVCMIKVLNKCLKSHEFFKAEILNMMYKYGACYYIESDFSNIYTHHVYCEINRLHKGSFSCIHSVRSVRVCVVIYKILTCSQCTQIFEGNSHTIASYKAGGGKIISILSALSTNCSFMYIHVVYKITQEYMKLRLFSKACLL